MYSDEKVLAVEPEHGTAHAADQIMPQGRKLQGVPGWRARAQVPAGFRDCSLIIPTFNRPLEASQLMRTLRGLPDVPAEVIMVDGSDNDATEREVRALLEESGIPFDFVYVKSPAGLTRQRNVGIDISTGEFVFFLDDDCIPEPGYFRELRQVFLDDEDGRIGAAGGILVNEIQDHLSLRWRIRLAFRLVPRIQPGMYHPSGTSVPRTLMKSIDGLHAVDMLSGCSMAFRRAVLDKHRFSLFFSGYSQGEDLEMSLRVRREWSIVWCGAARAFHNHAIGGRPASFLKGYMEARNRYFIWQRNSSNATRVDKLRFWLDMHFLVAVDCASWLRHPAQFHHLSHATGLVRGAHNCIVAPPAYVEPEPCKEYELVEG